MEKEALTIEPWAAWIAVAILAMVASVGAFTLWDRGHTSALEAVLTPTAVGDTHYVPARPSGLKYRNRNLDFVSEAKVRDSKLLRVGNDDSGVYFLYRPEDEKEGLLKDRYFMKVQPNEYIEVRAE